MLVLSPTHLLFTHFYSRINAILYIERSTSIKYHHRVNEAPSQFIHGILISHVADIVVRSANVGSGGDTNIPKMSKLVFKQTNLNNEVLEQIIQHLINRKTEIEDF